MDKIRTPQSERESANCQGWCNRNSVDEKLGKSLDKESLITHFIFSADLVEVRGSFQSVSVQNMQNVYSVKSIGFVRIIQGVVKNLALEAVIAATSSRMENTLQNWYFRIWCYGRKATRSFVCKGFSDEYQDKHAVVILHPGRISTVVFLSKMASAICWTLLKRQNDSEFRFVNYNAELILWQGTIVRCNALWLSRVLSAARIK